MDKLKWFNGYGHLQKEIPEDCVKDCTHQGDCSADVKAWVSKLGFVVPRKLAISYLDEYGAWDDFDTVSDETLAERVLWVACGDIAEEGEWFGICY